MRAGTVKRLLSGPRPVAVVLLLLLASFYLMSAATQNSQQFGRLYSLLLAINILGLALLVGLIVRHIVRLIAQLRRRAPGARLTARLVVLFVILALAPAAVVYYFSLQFVQRGIDSWFDVRVERALEDALSLSRTALEYRLQDALRQTRRAAADLATATEPVTRLEQARLGSKAAELVLFTGQGRIIASSGGRDELLTTLPTRTILQQLRDGEEYSAMEPAGESLQLRVAVPLRDNASEGEARMLLAVFAVPERLSALGENVQGAYARYQELTFLRQPLKYSFSLTLSLALLLSTLTAVWMAFFSARRLAAPIRDLAEGTRAVAAGDYDTRLPAPGHDELGFLVRSFNEMTRKIALARDDARRSQAELAAQHGYLETVLARLSSGVLTMGRDGRLYTANPAAGQILGVAPEALAGTPLAQLAERHPELEPFAEAIAPRLAETEREWRAEVVLFGPGGRQILMCRGSALPAVAEYSDAHVIVFDDLTALIQAQRDAAWAEVARRLAHEIKNPLTPIQLSAERLRRKYLDKMEPGEGEVLDRGTYTIVQQVAAMKKMVKAFSEYAHTPEVRLQPVDVNRLVDQVVELYRDDRRLTVSLELEPALPEVEADEDRLRQVLHNLLKNALEARAGGPVCVTVATRCIEGERGSSIELRLQDDGPGIAPELMAQLFEPYITSKPRGTGLGLAIVKKIVEEHGGVLKAANAPEGGAAITVHLPACREACEFHNRQGGEHG